MNYPLLIAIASSLFMASCASIHGSGKYAVPLNENSTAKSVANNTEKKGKNKEKNTTHKGLLISGSENTSMASKYFTLIDFTFENKSADWLKVTKVAIDFGNAKANSEIQFPVGQDLIDWARGAQQMKAIQNYNMELALGIIAGIGAGVAGASAGFKSQNATGLGAAGALTAVSSGIALGVNSIGNELDSLQRARVIPEEHLLSGAFSVPPGLFTRKWITLYAKNPNDIPFVKNIALTLSYADGTTESVLLEIRNLYHSSAWQKGHPEIILEEQKSYGLGDEVSSSRSKRDPR